MKINIKTYSPFGIASILAPEILKPSHRQFLISTLDQDQNESNKVKLVDALEMLVFQKNEPLSNKIKPVLTMSEETRLEYNKKNGDSNLLT
jgi:hypothetical protein